MTVSDQLHSFSFEDTPIHGKLVHLSETWAAVLRRRDYPPALQELLGHMMAAAALISATIRQPGSIIFQLQGEGPVSLIVVEISDKHTMRATANWSGEITSGPLPSLIGAAKLIITVDPGAGGLYQQRIVSLEGDNLATALEVYLLRVENLDTRLWLTVDAANASGMLLQKMPSSPEGENDDTWNRVVQLGASITAQELSQLGAVDIIRRLFHEEDVRLFRSKDISFGCSCSRERVIHTFRMLGAEEIHGILAEQDIVSVNCEFCNQLYEFDHIDIEQIFAADVAASPSPTQH